MTRKLRLEKLSHAQTLRTLPEQGSKAPVCYTQRWGKGSHIRKTQPFEPGAVCGLLTVEEQLGGGTSRYTRFRCRCGETVTRLHSDVRESMAKGALPACPKCREVAKREAEARRQEGQAP